HRPAKQFGYIRTPGMSVAGLDLVEPQVFSGCQVHLAGGPAGIPRVSQIMRPGSGASIKYGRISVRPDIRSELTGHHRSSRGSTHRTGAGGVSEEHALSGQPLQVRRPHWNTTAWAAHQHLTTVLVGADEQDVGPLDDCVR